MTIGHESPYTIALALLFIYGNECRPEDVKLVWPAVAKLASENDDPSNFEITCFAQLDTLADRWMLTDLRENVEDIILNWKTGTHWHHVALSDGGLPEALLHKLKAVFTYAPEGSSIRAKTVSMSTRFADFERWAGTFSISDRMYNKNLARGRGEWCEEGRAILQLCEPGAFQASDMLDEKEAKVESILRG